MDKKHLVAGLYNLLYMLPDEAVVIAEGHTTVEIFIDWSKVPEEVNDRGV
jgi:hypothetical protein